MGYLRMHSLKMIIYFLYFYLFWIFISSEQPFYSLRVCKCVDGWMGGCDFQLIGLDTNIYHFFVLPKLFSFLPQIRLLSFHIISITSLFCLNFFFSSSTDKVVVVSYNILGVENALKHPDLYYKVPPKFLEWDRRKILICEEINHYNASILCFQVNLQVFHW